MSLQKNGDARWEAECGSSRLCPAWHEPTSGLRGFMSGSVSQCSAPRCDHSGGDDEGGIRALPLRLSPYPLDARPSGDRHEPEEASTVSIARRSEWCASVAVESEPWEPGIRLARPQAPMSAGACTHFISDAFTEGRRFRGLAVVDDFTRECWCLAADTSLSGAQLPASWIVPSPDVEDRGRSSRATVRG